MAELVLVGLSHKTSPLGPREALASFGAAQASRRLREAGFPEAVVLSTCNRFELYARAAGPAPGQALASLMEAWAGAPAGGHLYSLEGAAAAQHLFCVASGLDSLVVGEGEILAQVKQGYAAARAAGMTGKLLNVLFQRALFVGKLVRSRTGISEGQVSVASVSVTLAQRIFGELKDSSVLILGAGKMADLAARHLLSGKVKSLRVANRTWPRAQEMARRFAAEPVRWEDFPALLEEVDIVIASTGAPQAVVTRDMVAGALATRRGRSLFLIDIAMPRDIEADVHSLEHVYLYTMDDLQSIVQENLSRRRGVVVAAEALVREKASEFAAWLAAGGGSARPLRHSALDPALDPVPSS